MKVYKVKIQFLPKFVFDNKLHPFVYTIHSPIQKLRCTCIYMPSERLSYLISKIYIDTHVDAWLNYKHIFMHLKTKP